MERSRESFDSKTVGVRSKHIAQGRIVEREQILDLEWILEGGLRFAGLTLLARRVLGMSRIF